MDIVVFVNIKKDATTCKGAYNPEDFIGKTCPVMEFDMDGGALVLNPNGTALAMFNKEDIHSSFKCGYVDGVITPPDLDMITQMMYVTKVKTRKWGYNNLLSNMIIQVSLMKGKFSDNMLWTRE